MARQRPSICVPSEIHYGAVISTIPSYSSLPKHASVHVLNMGKFFFAGPQSRPEAAEFPQRKSPWPTAHTMTVNMDAGAEVATAESFGPEETHCLFMLVGALDLRFWVL